MKMISQLVHQGQPLDTSQILEFMKVKKERSVSAALEHLLKNMKSKEILRSVAVRAGSPKRRVGTGRGRTEDSGYMLLDKTEIRRECRLSGLSVSESTHNA